MAPAYVATPAADQLKRFVFVLLLGATIVMGALWGDRVAAGSMSASRAAAVIVFPAPVIGAPAAQT